MADALPLTSFKIELDKPCLREEDVGEIGPGITSYPSEKQGYGCSVEHNTNKKIDNRYKSIFESSLKKVQTPF